MEPLKRAKQRTNKNIWIELVRNQYQRHANTDAQQYIHTHEIHWNHFILSSNVRSLLNYSHMSIFIKICPNILNGDTRIFKFEVCVHKSIMSRFNDWIKKTANNINKQRKWKKKKHLKTIKSFFFLFQIGLKPSLKRMANKFGNAKNSIDFNIMKLNYSVIYAKISEK